MNLKISKYDPSVDAAPKLISVSVAYRENMTVLEAIQFAHETTPINFDYSCRGRACGRCAVMLDGKPVLACVTPISNATHTIEPLSGQPVIRDLVVDRREAHASIAARYRRIRSTPLSDAEFNTTYNTGAIEQIDALEWCTRCMVCTAGCPAFKADPSSFVGPAEMLAVAYRYYDPYDQANREAEAVQAGLWKCIMCGQCDNLCPQKEIKRVKQVWKELRAAATTAGYTNPAT
jgi:fumarate reductase iron-sulfur subunit